MRRREFTGIGIAIGWPLAARAQRASMPIIGFMSARSPEDSVNVLQAFYKGLKDEGGFADGDNVKVEYRWARGNYALLPTLAGELVARSVNVLVAVGGDASARAAKAATSTIPVVFTISGDPVEAGLVQSINRPGGNATGCIVISTGELDAKRLEFVSEIVPGASIFGVLVNPKYPPAKNQARELEAAATKLGRTIRGVEASDDTELGTAFAALLQKGGWRAGSGLRSFFRFTPQAHHCFRGGKPPARHLPIQGLCTRRRPHQLRPEPPIIK
jgi:putative tryptophan/tyrosine transport system substrate-binding protein